MQNLPYRAWCRYQFFRDYKGAISDIEKLNSLVTYDTGYGINGDYHLNIMKGICYSALREKKKAIKIFQKQLKKEGYSAGLYDYYQLGVTFYEINDYKNALKSFERQSERNDIAENAYYIAKINKILENEKEYIKNKDAALKLYVENKKLFDPYTQHFNAVYYEAIVSE
ncbi:hypothetical protein D3C72_1193260 [compost metagenome]